MSHQQQLLEQLVLQLMWTQAAQHLAQKLLLCRQIHGQFG